MGALQLGQAMTNVGQIEYGTRIIRDAWVSNSFTTSEENVILATHNNIIRLEDHSARLIELLAEDDVNEARRQLGRVDAQTKRLADARITLKTTPANVLHIPTSLTSSDRSDPWFIFDYARALRRNGNDMEAWSVMRSTTGPVPSPERWWRERHIMARDALKLSAYDVSYQLTAENGMQSGGGFADAEFLSGWIALRYQDNPGIALEHFQRLAGGVSFPISRARAYYWSGRAQEELGLDEDAIASYQRAAEDPTTFYGQLALTRLSPNPILALVVQMPEPDRRLEDDDRIHAMNTLVDLDRRALVRIFAQQLANEDRSPGRMRYLADFMSGAGDQMQALRIAKLASYRDIMLLPYLDPIVDIPQAAQRDSVEPALILGLVRQESEFDHRAISHAGARGLMQLMPGTARQTARQIGVTYNQTRLTDRNYNMQLGSAHLEELLERWSGSYVLAIAAYNAGSRNVTEWVETYGDPQLPGVDVIDWIELIPFGETRNYVQRVLENIQVYRARLGGVNHPLEILEDLARSNAPIDDIPLPLPAPRG
jgi:soluble lytic murein transglycosylase